MNEVFLSGLITKTHFTIDQPASHFSFELTSLPHDANEHITSCTITINAWDKLAEWSTANLHAGDQVLVKGILVPSAIKEAPHRIEIAATRIVMI